MPAEVRPDDVAVPMLAAELLRSSQAQLVGTYEALCEGLQASLRQAEARRMAVEYEISQLLNSAYAPSTEAVRRAVFAPSHHLVERFVREVEVSDVG